VFALHQLRVANRLRINELAARASTQQSTVSLLVGKPAGAGDVRDASARR
jgi:hypothetical protein